MILVNSCIDCPFCVYDIDYDVVGDDTLLKCNLLNFKSKSYQNNIITSYDSNSKKLPKVKTPDFCPIKNDKILKITIKNK